MVMENFWACIVVSAIVSLIVNLSLSRFARDKTIEQLGRMLAAKPKLAEPRESRELIEREPVRRLRAVAAEHAAERASVPQDTLQSRMKLKAALLNLGWKATEIEKCITSFGPRVEREDIS